MSEKRSRRSFTAEQKAKILRRHLVDGRPVSDLCDENQLQPSVFYGWQRQLFDNAPLALQRARPGGVGSEQSKLERKIEKLEARLAAKDSVIAEISEEFVTLKKGLGEL